MRHEWDLFITKNAQEQCNSFRSHHWYSHELKFSFGIPRSHSGNFYSALLGFIRSEEKSVQSYSIYFIPKVLHLSVPISFWKYPNLFEWHSLFFFWKNSFTPIFISSQCLLFRTNISFLYAFKLFFWYKHNIEM